MERRIMKQGPSTLVVSMPSKWIKKHSVKKGDLVYLEERGKSVLVNLSPKPSEKEITLNLSGTLPMTHRIVGAMYKAGFDEMKLKYSQSAEGEAILEAVRVMTGHEVVNHQRDVITIKRLVKADSEHSETLYRKCFHVLKDMIRDTIEALNKNDSELMRSVIMKDNSMAIFADYSRRMLLAGNAPNYGSQLYHIIVQIEKIADRFKYICRHYESEKKKIGKESLNVLKKIGEFVESFEILFYGFSLEKATAFGKERKEIQKLLSKVMNTSSKHDLPILMHCESILSMTFDLNGPLLTIHLQKQYAV